MQETVLQAQLAAAYNYFQSIQHQQNMERIRELCRKLSCGEYGIAFAGHFSAGKSRMINALLGQDFLPSSPIPTSANLVKVQKAENEEFARVFFRQGKPRKYLAPYDYDLLRSFCRDGDEIAEIDLYRQDIDLPEKVVIMDTPGIDSADDAHRAATEAALHLADIILFVMDYNHVQSELNLAFTKSLTMSGKEVYLIINQIDKHEDSELSFQAFQQGTEKAFLAWGVQPAGVFYTSLKFPELAQNQFPQVKAMLQQRIAERQSLLAESVAASLQKILQEYLQQAKERLGEECREAQNILEQLGDTKVQQLCRNYQALAEEKQALELDWTENFGAEVNKILDNAYLMPTAIRDLARDYLEACQPDFKVGMFTRGKKTLAEIDRRREVFFQAAAEKAQNQLAWHVKNYFTAFARERHIDTPELLDFVQAMEIVPDESLLEEAMRSGARLTQDGSYVMNYTANFAEGTKNVARRYAAAFKDKAADLIQQRNQARSEEISVQMAAMSENYQAWEAVAEAKQQLARLTQAAADIMDAAEAGEIWQEIAAEQPLSEEIIYPHTDKGTERRQEATCGGNAPAGLQETAGEAGEVAAEADKMAAPPAAAVNDESADSLLADTESGKQPAADNQPLDSSVKAWAQKLQYASQLVGEIPLLRHLAVELAERSQRLADKRYTVTLFGAFSAGKSSFANALLGSALLPVSPNPTTAAINKICPVDEAHPHGTVAVKVKSEAMMLDDVNRALSVFGRQGENLAAALHIAEEVVQEHSADGLPEDKAVQHDFISKDFLSDDIEAAAEKHPREKSFLRAFCRGFAAVQGKFGENIACGLNDFPAYAAQEEKSCFVDWIEVYFACPLTELGITLVDTPGADSLNARHTNVSFNFIRQSDVVLFVTYYNHAFNRADREFLIQLGRVKDAFALDKMFFIVNAIDLAENQAEAEGVIDYVAGQLKKFGVKKPRMFGISSQQTLAKKQAGDVSPSAFEAAFYGFVFKELAAVALQAAKTDYEAAVRKITELIALEQGDQTVREQQRCKLIADKEKAMQVLAQFSPQDFQQQMQRELVELLYYAQQRVFLRFTDFFRESFNPSVLRKDRDEKQNLRHAMDEFIANLGYDFAQELRATALRMEQFLQRGCRELQQHLNGKLLEINRELSITVKKYNFEGNMEFVNAFQQLPAEAINRALKIYKNPRSFFQEGGAKEMAAELEKILQPEATAYGEKNREYMEKILTEGLVQLAEKIRERFTNRLEENFTAAMAMLEGGVPLDKLQQIQRKLIEQ